MSKKRKFYSFKAKREIVEEAYAKPRLILPTAIKDSIQPQQIRRWKAAISSHYSQPRITAPNDNRRLKKMKTFRKGFISEDEGLSMKLREFMDDLRRKYRLVDVTKLCHQYCRIADYPGSFYFCVASSNCLINHTIR